METPTFYLETSVWGSLAPKQKGDRKHIVRRLLTLLDGNRGMGVISGLVLDEILKGSEAVTAAIRPTLNSLPLSSYPITQAVEALGRAYVDADVLPPRREADALHVAAATYFECDYLVSWNHRHLTRPTRRVKFEAVNQLNGYAVTPFICNPMEACNELRGR